MEVTRVGHREDKAASGSQDSRDLTEHGPDIGDVLEDGVAHDARERARGQRGVTSLGRQEQAVRTSPPGFIQRGWLRIEPDIRRRGKRDLGEVPISTSDIQKRSAEGDHLEEARFDGPQEAAKVRQG
jgi:hypothetical protein